MNMLKDFDIKTPVIKATLDLFETMISLKLDVLDSDKQPEFDGARITGSLSFAGKLTGSINFHTSEAFARMMTASMLDIEEQEIQNKEEVNDVILELCNIIGGNLKSNFNDSGMPCVISTPSITTGRDFEIESMNMDMVEQFNFSCMEHKVFIEIFVKLSNIKDDVSQHQGKVSSIDIAKFKKLDIISSTGDTVVELFDKMLSMELEFADTESLQLEDGASQVGVLNFAGQVTGSISIQVSDKFARIITAKLLGIKEEAIESNDQIKDVVGEISHIVGGNLKGAFCDSGLECEMSTPAITAGNDYKIQTFNMDRYERYAFQYEKHCIFVEVCVKIEEDVKNETAQEQQANEIQEGKNQRKNDRNEQPKGNNTEENNTEANNIENNNINAPDPCQTNIDMLLDIPLKMTAELGRTKIEIQKLLEFNPGDAVTFSNLEGEPIDILVNNKLIAKGTIIVENEKYGICITKTMSRMDRIKSLG